MKFNIPDFKNLSIPKLNKETLKMEMPKMSYRELFAGLKENKLAFYGIILFIVFLVLVLGVAITAEIVQPGGLK